MITKPLGRNLLIALGAIIVLIGGLLQCLGMVFDSFESNTHYSESSIQSSDRRLLVVAFADPLQIEPMPIGDAEAIDLFIEHAHSKHSFLCFWNVYTREEGWTVVASPKVDSIKQILILDGIPNGYLYETHFGNTRRFHKPLAALPDHIVLEISFDNGSKAKIRVSLPKA